MKNTQVNKILRDRVKTIIASFKEQRESDLEELARLEQEIEYHEAEKKRITVEQKGLNVVREKDKSRSFEIVLDLKSHGKKITECQGQINALMSKLTSIPDFEEHPSLLNFLLVVTGKGFRPNGGELPKSKG
jgi:chromosome segregation ATPase